MRRDLEVVSAHRERAVIVVGDLVLKVAADAAQLDREVSAMAVAASAGVPVPEVRWRQAEALGLALVPGRALGALGEACDSSPEAWAAAGAMLRRLHDRAAPSAWDAHSLGDLRVRASAEVRWIVDRGIAPAAVVDRVGALVAATVRPFSAVFTHGDPQPAHVFVDDHDAVVGVIDWADAGRGDPLSDLAILTVGFEERLADVVRGYGDPMVEADLDVIRGHWAARRLRSVRWMIEHGFDATGDVAALLLMAGEVSA